MATLFVSHSSEDAQLTANLVAWLRAEGYDALFVDVDAQHGLVGGRNWERELYAQLRMSDALIFLGTPAAANSRWCFAEITLARSIGKPVIPVLAAGEERLGLLADVQWVDMREPTAEALARLAASMQQVGLDARDSFPWSPTRAPYPGLEAFSTEDAGVFYGRGTEIAELQERMQPNMQRARGQFLAVVGPSGSGKSSLVGAGLVPRLARMADRWVVVPRFVPGQHPVTSLARSLVRAAAAYGLTWDQRSVEEIILRGSSPALIDLADRLVDAAGGGPQTNVLLFCDQAEELVSRTQSVEATWFVDLLRHALHRESPLWVVATLRSEFLGPLISQIGAAGAVDDTYVVGPLSRSQLPAIIERPAQRAGISFEPGLVQRMVEDAVGGDSLPLLAFTLRQLYERIGASRYVTHADYDAVGGVIGAMRRQADSVVATLGRKHPTPLIFSTLLLLISVEPGREPVRRRALASSLRAEQAEIVQALVDARLLLSHEIDTADGRAETVIEVAHEALLRQWEPLRATIEVSRRGLEVRSEIEDTARAWLGAGRDESFLPLAARLGDAADEFGPAFAAELSEREREFLAAGHEHKQREVVRQRRANRRLRMFVVGLAVLVLVAGTSAVIALNLRREAVAQQRIATARGLVSQADALAETDPLTGIRLTVAAARINDEATTTNALVDTLSVARQRATLGGHTDEVVDLAAAPDGKMVATASIDKTMRLWNVEDRLRPNPIGAPLTDHGSRVWSVAFSADGKTLASAGDDGIRLRTTAAPTSSVLLPKLRGVGSEVTFAATGKRFAAGGTDGTIVLYDITAPTDVAEVGSVKFAGVMFSLKLSSRGLLAATGEKGALGVWDVSDPDNPTTVKLPENPHSTSEKLRAVAFTPDGKTMFTTGEDDIGVFWNVADPNKVTQLGSTLPTSTNRTYAATFSADGKTLVTGSGDEAATLWDVADPARPTQVGASLQAHEGLVGALALVDEGSTLVSSGDDGNLILWDVSDRATPELIGDTEAFVDEIVSLGVVGGQQRWVAVGGSTLSLWGGTGDAVPARLGSAGNDVGSLRWVTVSPDGKRAATGVQIGTSADDTGAILFWDIADPAKPTLLDQPRITGLTTPVWRLAYSPNGQVLAVGGDYALSLYDMREPDRPVLIEQEHGEASFVKSLAFSPDGRYLASVLSDKKVLLWDLSDSAHPKPLDHRLELESDGFGLAYSPDGATLVAGGRDGSVSLWDVADPTQPVRLGAPIAGGHGIVWSIAFSPDGTSMATGHQDKTVRLWDIRDRGRVRPASRPLTGPSTSVEALAFSASGRSLAGESGAFWSLVELQRLRTDPVTGACRVALRGLDADEWDRYIPDLDYRDTCAR